MQSNGGEQPQTTVTRIDVTGETLRELVYASYVKVVKSEHDVHLAFAVVDPATAVGGGPGIADSVEATVVSRMVIPIEVAKRLGVILQKIVGVPDSTLEGLSGN